MSETNKVIVPLSQPIQVQGNAVSELALRSPKGGDLAACGVPPAMTSLGTPEFGGYVRSLISRLAEIPPSAVDQMEALDWLDAMKAALDFFRPRAALDTP